jgi:hypothetical protein
MWQRNARSADDDGFACKRRIACMPFATRHPRAIECDTLPELSKKTIKRKVAMWVGYVGTHYKGIPFMLLSISLPWNDVILLEREIDTLT